MFFYDNNNVFNVFSTGVVKKVNPFMNYFFEQQLVPAIQEV